jgi:DNA-binding response OmpR family regulator
MAAQPLVSCPKGQPDIEMNSPLMRVLIAEDDPALASFVRKGLEAEHYAVDVTTDGEQARAMAGELDYDLLMLDLNLPRMDGVTILRHLRTQKPSLPILVLTSRNRVEDRVQCLDLGADDYMGKPFSFAELSARIRALLRRSHLPAAAVLSVADLKLDRVERRGGARRQTNRADVKRIRTARIPNAECRTASDPRHDH